jgi:uncharacterized membrane protein
MAQKTLVIVFEDEAKAYGAWHALERLQERGDLSLDGLAVVVKNPDGSVRTVKIGRSWSVARAIAGGLVGGLFGVSGGPVGLTVGLIGGSVIGSIRHKRRSVDAELDKDISDALTAGKAAVIAEVLEESELFVDARMAALDGIVFRWTSDQIRTSSHDPKIQRTIVKVDRRDSLDPKIDELRAKIENALESRMAKAEARKQQRERWIHLMQEEAAQARTKRKEQQAARIRELET